jgi:hypothetical protein
MTAQRQERNGSRFEIRFRPGIALIAPLAAVLWIGLGWASLDWISPGWLGLGAPGPGLLGRPQFAAQAATTERVVVNRFSGVAIEGYDPVAYFVDARPTIGLADFEASQAGAVWRFRNEGNRASFVAHPDIYGPQYGGYDPIDLARGVTYAGNPRFWLVSGERLYLFGREQNRDAFAADPAHVLREANMRWPKLELELAQ